MKPFFKTIKKISSLFLIVLSFNSIIAQTPIWSTKYDYSINSNMKTSFSVGSVLYAYGSDKGEVTLMEVSTGEVYLKYNLHKNQVFCAIFQPKGHILASGDKKGKLVMFDSKLKKENFIIDAHTDAITDICFSPEGDIVATGSYDDFVKVWDVATGKKISEINLKSNICAIKFTPDGKKIVAGTTAMSDGVHIIDVASGKENLVVNSKLTEYLDISPNGKFIATANIDKEVSIWDLKAGWLLYTLKGHGDYIRYVSYNRYKNILVSASDDKSVIFWNVDKRTKIGSYTSSDKFENIALSSDGEYMATLCRDKTLKIWKVSSFIKDYDSFQTPDVYTGTDSENTKQEAIINTVKAIDSNKKSTADDISNYARSSLTVVFLNFLKNDPYSNDLKRVFDSLQIPGKYNDNQIDVKFICPDFPMRDFNVAKVSASNLAKMNEYDADKMQKISDLLKTAKVPDKIMAKWFNKSPDGKFNMNLVYERGLYNATDAEYNDARLTYRGPTVVLKDAGQKLVDKSYVLVIDFGNILTREQFKDIKNYVKGETNTDKGFETDIKCFLYKIDGGSAQKIYDIWDEGSKFDQLDFPLIPITQLYKKNFIDVYEPGKPREYLFKALVNKAVEQAEYWLTEKFEDFRIKAPVFKTRGGLFPVAFAKIGKKEDIKLENRFFVWEIEEGSDGNKIAKRKGVVRVSNKIVDNSIITTGKTGLSKFYQIQGKKLNQGMILQQKNDWYSAYSMGVGYALSDYENAKSKIKYKSPLLYTLRLDINMSKGTKRWPSDIRMFIDLSYMGKAKVVDGQSFVGGIIPESLSSTFVWSLGASKDFHIMKNIKIEPFFQWNLARQLTLGNHGDDNKYQLKLSQLGYGCRLPISLTYWMEFVPGVTMFIERGLSKVAEKQDKILVSPMYINAAIRFSY